MSNTDVSTLERGREVYYPLNINDPDQEGNNPNQGCLRGRSVVSLMELKKLIKLGLITGTAAALYASSTLPMRTSEGWHHNNAIACLETIGMTIAPVFLLLGLAKATREQVWIGTLTVACGMGDIAKIVALHSGMKVVSLFSLTTLKVIGVAAGVGGAVGAITQKMAANRD